MGVMGVEAMKALKGGKGVKAILHLTYIHDFLRGFLFFFRSSTTRF
jgi:hypothetical protein